MIVKDIEIICIAIDLKLKLHGILPCTALTHFNLFSYLGEEPKCSATECFCVIAQGNKCVSPPLVPPIVYHRLSPPIVPCAPNKCYDKNSCRGDGHWCEGMSYPHFIRLRGRYFLKSSYRKHYQPLNKLLLLLKEMGMGFQRINHFIFLTSLESR